jgi:hypothetical protein
MKEMKEALASFKEKEKQHDTQFDFLMNQLAKKKQILE